MSDFLSKVHKAIGNMGKGPYDDKKTDEAVMEAHRKTEAAYNLLREKKDKNSSSP